MDTVQERLKEFAQYIGSATKLANLLDMSPQSFIQYTNGRSKPGFEIISKLYNLGCNINWLVSGKGTMLRVSAPAITNAEEKKVKKEKLTIEERMERLEKAVLALKKENSKKTTSRSASRATAGKENSYV